MTLISFLHQEKDYPKGTVSIKLTPSLTLKYCLYATTLSHKLLSISYLTKEPNCTVPIHPIFCRPQDVQTRKIVGCGSERDGFYFVDEVDQHGAVALAHGTIGRE